MGIIIDFYSGKIADSQGRSFSSMLDYSDKELEETHDYIQLLFPLPEASHFNPSAPTLTLDDIAAFRARPALRQNMRRALKMMRTFYASDLQWVSPNNHNFLRITRILKSLCLCGLRREAAFFLRWLYQLRPLATVAVIGNSWNFWEEAVRGLPRQKATPRMALNPDDNRDRSGSRVWGWTGRWAAPEDRVTESLDKRL